MAKVIESYADNAGRVHPTIKEAVISDIAAALGRMSADQGIVGGGAKAVFDKREAIEAAFRDFDQMEAEK